jgi:hypothetical protein
MSRKSGKITKETEGEPDFYPQITQIYADGKMLDLFSVWSAAPCSAGASD